MTEPTIHLPLPVPVSHLPDILIKVSDSRILTLHVGRSQLVLALSESGELSLAAVSTFGYPARVPSNCVPVPVSFWVDSPWIL